MTPSFSIKTSFFVFLFLGFTAIVSAQTTPFTVTYAFKGIVDGYDHLCKTQVWLDGNMVGESDPVKESIGGSFTVNVPMGDSDVRIVNLAKYEDEWEEHTIENEYSIDCAWSGNHNFSKKKQKVFLLFDLDSGTTVSWKKMPK